MRSATSGICSRRRHSDRGGVIATARASILRGSVQYLSGVGPRRAEKLARLGVRTARDLLYLLPHRYEDATTVSPASSLKPGDDATVIGRVVSKGIVPTRRGLRIFHAVLRDRSGLIECAWPGQPWLDRTLKKGDLLLASGPVRFFHGRQLQPREFTVLAGADEKVGDGSADSSGIVFPVYPATEGLSHRQVRAIVETNLDRLVEEAAEGEFLDATWRRELGLPALGDALRALHRPERTSDVEPARRRLAYEELLFMQLLHARARERLRQASPGRALDAPADLTRKFLGSVSFELTAAQRRAWEEIRTDMESPARMYRLLQGDVGSGKTVVALAAMLRAVENGFQAALMAPTELLAEQHARTLTELLAPVDMEPLLLTGSVTPAERAARRQAIARGEARIVVGTHALIQEGVEFADLALAVVDEQHRFGVEQRRLLHEADARADTLVMSATPIPRSVALTLHGDLDLSVIDEMPPGRRPVKTGIRGPTRREVGLAFVEAQIGKGRQAYFVVPLIEESEAIDARAATELHAEMEARFPDFEVGLLHGRLPTAAKDDVMRRFLAGDIHLVVATSVVEVGIDVANATVMWIESAERFGLAQLHQLRGRVGRGSGQSWCIAFHPGGELPERLRVFAATNDGFELARQDLRLRGMGNLFGPEQHGVPAPRFADLERDADLFEDARRRARAIIAEDPELSQPAHRPLARELAEHWTEIEKLYGVG